ncbi:MAG: pyridoxal-phosphate dependent enzyme [Agarilytica sp.]
MAKLYNSILETIGNTPVVRINNLGPKNVNIYAKVESFNPMGSVKDRLALGVIEDAEKRGELSPGQTIVEATSGNTGIGLAMVCAQKGYPLVITMAESFSVERRKLMRFLGAKVVLTPAAEKGTGMVNKARELAAKNGWWQSRQFENPANAEMHVKTTAQEIIDAFSDRKLDYWVSGYGTGGTFNGVSSVLRDKSPETQIVICEPENAQLLASGVSQQRKEDGAPDASHPSFTPHPMQGWTPDFIPLLTEEAIEGKRADTLLPVRGPVAIQASKDLAQKEGIFVGISGGATFAAALSLAENAADGANILCMLPDTGERYLSTPLFEGIEADMNEEELAIASGS